MTDKKTPTPGFRTPKGGKFVNENFSKHQKGPSGNFSRPPRKPSK